MNILHINDKIENSGGVETNIQHLCELGHNYSLKSYWIGVYENLSGYSVKCYPNQVELVNGVLIKIIDFIDEFCKVKKIDVIHVHSISNPVLLEGLFRLKPVVRSMRDQRMFCPGQGKFWRKSEEVCNVQFGLKCFFYAYKEGCCNRHPKRLIEAYNNVCFETKEGNENYAAVIVMSDYMYDEASKAGFDKEKLFLNPHLTPLVDEHELVHYNINEKKSLLYVGRLSRTKGIHYFINTGIELIKKGYNITLDIVGDGHDSTYFKSLIPEEYREKIIFHGWQSRENIDFFVKRCYLLVFPSIYPEAFGISGIEAMMRAKPVVGFNVGGVSTWLKDGKTGFLVPVKDTVKLLEKVELLINNEKLYKEMSKKSREVALIEFTPDKHFHVLKDVYSNSIKNTIE